MAVLLALAALISPPPSQNATLPAFSCKLHFYLKHFVYAVIRIGAKMFPSVTHTACLEGWALGRLMIRKTKSPMASPALGFKPRDSPSQLCSPLSRHTSLCLFRDIPNLFPSRPPHTFFFAKISSTNFHLIFKSQLTCYFLNEAFTEPRVWANSSVFVSMVTK